MVVLTAVFSLTLSACVAAKMPVPAVKEGRFNYTVVYEIDGEVITYSDAYVCKYDGSYKSLYGGGIDWTGYLESTGGAPEIAIQTNDDGVIYIGLGFYPHYFMGDIDYIDCSIPETTLYIIYHSDDPDMMQIDSQLDFMAEYGIRVISFTYDQPIENTFEEKFTVGRLDISIN